MKKWINNNKFDDPCYGGSGYVSIENGTLIFPVTDIDNAPHVCGYVYKVHEKSNGSFNGTARSNESVTTKYVWEKVAQLTTKDDPAFEEARHHAVSIQNGIVFTGRMDPDFYGQGSGYGKVFFHDLQNILI